MRYVIDGLSYDTAKMKILAQHSVYNNGNYAGDDSIRVTAGGRYCLVETTNGQDLFRDSSITALTKGEVAAAIQGWRLDEYEYEQLLAHGLIKQA